MRLNRVSSTVALAALAASLPLAPSCRSSGPSKNVLADRSPARADGVANAGLLTDGHAADDGSDWNAPAATVFQSPRAFVEYDLGRSERLESAYLQGDNNDEYVVSVSEDGVAFHELWVAPPVASPGLRGRSTEGLGGRGRYVRLSARGGDNAYSVSELQLWTGAPPSSAAPASSETLAGRVRTAFIYFVLAFGLVIFATRAGSPRRNLVVLWTVAAIATVVVLDAVATAWPLGAREISGARAAAAAIVLLALLRGWDRVRAAPPHRPTILAACAVGAVLAFACFYNFGRGQFWHHGKQRPTFVHVVDMRIYQPFAKYFDELRYDGVYLASALAVAEEEHGGSIDAIGATKIRDMHDFRMRTALEMKDQILQVRQRFSEARWAAFKQDIKFFREAMGPSFLTSLDDHGANAPPSWVWLARFAVGHVTASEASLTAAGLLDAALLLAMAWAIAATFGLLPMLVAMTVFGATDLYLFGTNWGGATLRHDWMVLLGFAACALRRRRWLLGGALLGLGTILRVVPAVGLMGVAVPVIAAAVAQIFGQRRLDLRALLAEHRAAVRVLGAAAATMVVVFLITGALYSFAAWTDWFARIKTVNDDLATNEVDLRMLIAGVDQTAGALLRARRPLFVAVQLASLLVVALAARKRPLEDAMLLGLPFALVFMNSLNYHDHALFLLVLLGARAGLLGVAAPLLATCLAGYWADLDPDAARHFEVLTVLLFAAVGCVLFSVARPPAPAPPPIPPPSPAAPPRSDG